MPRKLIAPSLIAAALALLFLLVLGHDRWGATAVTTLSCPESGPCAVKRTCGQEALCDQVNIPAGPLIPLTTPLPERDPAVRAIRAHTHLTGSVHALTAYWPDIAQSPNLRDVPVEVRSGKPYRNYDGFHGHYGLFYIESARPHVGTVVEWSQGSRSAAGYVPEGVVALPRPVDFTTQVVETYDGIDSDRAIIDRRTGYGLTYAKEPDGSLTEHRPDSTYIWNRWADTIHTTCGGWPLTKLPPAWERNPPPVCRAAS